jgi:hypothetical protein
MDDKTLLVYSEVGTCSAGKCTYASSTHSCQSGCANGKCTGDPCLGVTCAKPPHNTCKDDNTLTVYGQAGTCGGQDGTCTYPSSQLPCPQGCADDKCSGDPCAGITCATPPANSCEDNKLTIYSISGTCSNGDCNYSTRQVSCANGCDNGRCKDDPCLGITCATPPANKCKEGDANTLIVYAATGSCISDGSCDYSPTEQACPNGCSDGQCSGDPCAGKICRTPEANYCKDTMTLIVYSEVGRCDNGDCTYESSTQACMHGCDGGACKDDPCAGITCATPPSTSCLEDGMTLRTYSDRGTCEADGACKYTPSDMTCANGCADAACKDDPCAGKTCNEAPAAECADDMTLKIYSDVGMCKDGECDYPSSTKPCPNGCAGGECKDDPCLSKTCDMPPADSCNEDGTLKHYDPASGKCENGECVYDSTDMTCTNGCSDGACS